MDRTPIAHTLELPIDDQTVEADLHVPDGARGLVVFAHGSGSSRNSPRNRAVADHLGEHGLATLRFDLLTTVEETIDQVTGEYRFDIPLLARRLVAVTDWAVDDARTRDLRIGYFGASTGAAAALIAAAARPAVIGAVVSRGGRPDLAVDVLGDVEAATLLIVGGNDRPVVDLNRRALARLRADRRMAIIPGATHLFEQDGALEQVAELAASWFTSYLAGPSVRLPHGEPVFH